MRNSERIRPVLEALELIWRRAPDLRFGQLLINLGYDGGNHIYYQEDDEALEHFREVLNA